MRARFCDETEHGFSWTLREPATRTSHALAANGRLWLVDPVDWPEAVDRALTLGVPAGVVQLLDRHNRDCAALAERLGVPHVSLPDTVPGSPFAAIRVVDAPGWHERALWWPETRTLVVAEAVGTNPFFTARRGLAGMHLLLRLTPPRGRLGGFQPEHLLVGHGVGLHGAEATEGLRYALDSARSDLPAVIRLLPDFARDARARRRRVRD